MQLRIMDNFHDLTLWDTQLAQLKMKKQKCLEKQFQHRRQVEIKTNLNYFRVCTGLDKRVGPRLRESRILTPSGRGGRVHAT